MDRRRYELATIAAARALRSTYCTVAHASFLRDACGDLETVAALAQAPDGSTLSGQDAAVYTFATKGARDASTVEQADVDDLRAAGLTDAMSPTWCSLSRARSSPRCWTARCPPRPGDCGDVPTDLPGPWWSATRGGRLTSPCRAIEKTRARSTDQILVGRDYLTSWMFTEREVPSSSIAVSVHADREWGGRGARVGIAGLVLRPKMYCGSL
jgi:hypothetical protein